MSEQLADHFLVGSEVEVDDRTGTVTAVIEHTVDDGDGERTTHTRVVVDGGDWTLNVGTDEVELL